MLRILVSLPFICFACVSLLCFASLCSVLLCSGMLCFLFFCSGLLCLLYDALSACLELFANADELFFVVISILIVMTITRIVVNYEATYLGCEINKDTDMT